MPNLTVSTPTTETKLERTSSVRIRLGASSSDDTLIGDLIEEASDEIARYIYGDRTDCTLAYQVYSEKVAGYDDEYLALSRYPLVSISQVLHDTTVVSSTVYEIYDPDSALLYNATGWAWTARFRGDVVLDRMPGSEELDYTVSYGAGYQFPGVTTSNSTFASTSYPLPRTIRRACILTVQEWYSAEGFETSATEFAEIRTEDFAIKTHGGSESEARQERELPESAKSLLKDFRMRQ